MTLTIKETAEYSNIGINKIDDIRNYDGKDVIVTILDYPYRQLQRGKLNLDRFVKPSDRGKKETNVSH